MLTSNRLIVSQRPIVSYAMTAALFIISLVATGWITYNYLHFRTKLETDLRQSIEIAQQNLLGTLSAHAKSNPHLLAQLASKGTQPQNDSSLASINEILAGAHSRIMNYTTLIDQNSFLLAQQITHDNTHESGTIFDLLSIARDNPLYQAIIKALAEKKAQIIKYTDPAIGQQVWIALKPIDDTSLSIMSAIYPADVFKESIAYERHHIFLMSIGALFCVCLLFILIAFFVNTFAGWWMAVGLISLACIAELGFLWHQAITRAQEKHTNYTEVVDHNQLDAFISTVHEKMHKRSMTLIATGVFIEEMVFSSEGNGLVFANISGYIWQRYEKKNDATLKKDFLLPDVFLLNKNLISTKSDESYDTYCWQFNCKLYETTTLLTYPFDHRHVNLRIIHPQLLDSVMLVPDFTSYKSTNPYLLPGISSAIDLSNWHMYSSYFCYTNAQYNASLGIAPVGQLSRALPQMIFSMLCQRTVIGEFMSYLILILLTVIVLFILLLSFSKHDQYAPLLGFNNISIISALSGLLFVLIISQISLRQNLDLTGISYIESFYFICYFLIIAMAINSILFVYGKGGSLIQYEHNLIPKLIYWPLFFFLAIFATLIAFY